MVNLIIHLIIVLLVVGFLYWAYQKLMPLAPIEGTIRQVIDVLVVILVGAIILFYAIIPVLNALGTFVPIR